MAKAKEDPKPTPAVEPEINETDGEPIFHADEEATTRAPWPGRCT